jgi:hypothetical protein
VICFKLRRFLNFNRFSELPFQAEKQKTKERPLQWDKEPAAERYDPEVLLGRTGHEDNDRFSLSVHFVTILNPISYLSSAVHVWVRLKAGKCPRGIQYILRTFIGLL